jgi:hypothetical protein
MKSTSPAPLALVPALLLGLTAMAQGVAAEPAATPAALSAEEPQQIEDRQVPVWAKKEVSFDVVGKDEDDVQSRELWFASFDGKAWGDWQKHGIVFAKGAPVTWAPNEGHWKLYFRKTLISGLAAPVPGPATKAKAEFIIDRTPPVVTIAFPTAKAKLRGGQKYTIRWEASDPHLKGVPIALRWSRDGKGTFETIAEGIPNTGTYEWTTPKDMTIAGQLQVLAADKAGNVGTAESSQVLVDSVNPHGKVVGPAISAKSEVALDLDVADVGPAGLATARLWVSQDDGTSWIEGPFIQDPFKSVTWKATIDGRFRLAVVATDAAGNSNATPKGKSDDQFVLTVDTTAPTVQLASAIGIVEADKTTSSRRAFKAGDRVAVPFTIKDANLAANSVTVYLQTDAAKGWTKKGENLPADSAFRFEIPAAPSKQARIKVTAVDLAGNVGEVVATETFQIDTEVLDDEVKVK